MHCSKMNSYSITSSTRASSIGESEVEYFRGPEVDHHSNFGGLSILIPQPIIRLIEWLLPALIMEVQALVPTARR